MSFDLNGNTTQDNVHGYSWDAEGKMLSVDANAVGLVYDALGRMVEQTRGTSYTQIVYGLRGEKLALMTGNGQTQTLSKAFVALPAGAVAVYGSGGTLSYFRHPDWLGSGRISSDTGHNIVSDLAYAPFGETYAESGTPDRSFTGQNQDTIANGTTGLYDFLYREYALYGRWISPDPAGTGAVSLADPQSWNRYAYVRNNPLSFTDPVGQELCDNNGVCLTDAEAADINAALASAGDSLANYGYTYVEPAVVSTVYASTPASSEDGTLTNDTGISAASGSDPSTFEGGQTTDGGGSAANNGIKQTICGALPQGRVTSLNGSVGLVGGQQGSVQQVVNYNNGEVSNFFTGGLQVGWNGGASASASAGFIYKSGGQFVNSDFSGPFNNVSGSAPEGPGGSASWASNGVKIVQGGVGVNLIPGPTGNYSRTWTSKPFQGGNVWTNLPSPLGLFDLVVYGLRKAGGC